MIKTLIVSGITALVVAFLFVSLVGDNQSGSLGATGTRFPNGISADNTSPTTGQVRGTTLSVTGGTTKLGTNTSINTLYIGASDGCAAVRFSSTTQTVTSTTTSFCN